MLYRNILNLKGNRKIQLAINYFPLPFIDFIAMDIGASAGGFITSLLKKRAKLVYAVDSGYNILNFIFLSNLFVQNLEKVHINKANFLFYPKPQIIVIDVSFISVRKFIHKIEFFSSSCMSSYILIKPQFEILSKLIGKNGIISLHYIHKMCLLNIIYKLKNNLGYSIIGFMPIFQSKNLEYWLIIEKIKDNL